MFAAHWRQRLTRYEARRILSIADVVQGAIFVVGLFVLVQTFRGHMRSAGPALLLTLLLPATLLGAGGGLAKVALQAIFLALAAAGSALLYETPTGTREAWLGWHLLLGGLGFAVLESAPLFLRTSGRSLFDHMTAHPDGTLARVFALLAVALPACVLFLTTSVTRFSGDTMPTVGTIVRMYQDGTRDLSPYAAEPRLKRWVSYAGQNPPYNMHPSPYAPGLYSAYPAGMELFAWPGVLICDALGYDLRDDDVQRLIEYRTAALLSSVALALFYLTALHVTEAWGAFLTTVGLATGSVFFTTFGQLLWQQGGVAFWSVVILFVEIRSQGRPGWRGTLTQGVACGLMLACRPLSALFLVPFGLWVLTRDWKRGLLVPALAILTFAPFGVLYWELHRSLTGPSSCLYGGLGWPSLRNLSGLLFSPGRGLFVYQPLLLLLGFSLLRAFQSERLKALRFYPFVVAFAVLHGVLISGWVMWWGGHCLGSRLMGEVVPVAALAVAPVVSRLWPVPVGRLAVALLLVVGFLVHYNAAYHLAINWNVDPVDVDHKVSRVWKWADPPFAYIYQPK